MCNLSWKATQEYPVKPITFFLFYTKMLDHSLSHKHPRQIQEGGHDSLILEVGPNPKSLGAVSLPQPMYISNFQTFR